jgi:hypothetical protein
MKLKLALVPVLVAATTAAALTVGTGTSPAGAAPAPTTPTTTPWALDDYDDPRPQDDVAIRWNQQLLDTIKANAPTTGPTITARALGVTHTAMYDAWAAYDGVAKGTRLGGTLRQPLAERTGQAGIDNKNKAISFAAYKTLSWLFPAREGVYRAQLTDPPPTGLGYTLSDISTAASVGNQAADAVIAFRKGDGANQLGDHPSTPVPGTRYADYTGYTPKNTFFQVNDPWKWQPLCVPLSTANGTTCGGTVQRALTPQWGNVTAFARTGSSYILNGPPRNADGSYQTGEIDELVQQTANLTDRQKAQAEYWADGPGSVFPPGHDFLFAQAVSRKNGYSLDANVKLFFALGNAMMDASIVSWYQKYKWDFVRPITAIRERYKGKLITSWRGPGQGYGQVDGSQWMPFQALNVVTPGFPEYVSGHSTFSGAGMGILTFFTGGDTFGASVTVPAGSLKIEPGTPATDVTFTLPSWSQTGEDAGTSRKLGGIHFKSGDLGGRSLGRQIAGNVWTLAQNYWNGRTTG